MKAAHIIVSGYVQGVGFRSDTQRRASRLDLSGWVRNIPDGSVEIHVEGDEAALGEFLEWCRVGPSDAVVEDVSVDWVPAEGGLRGFMRR
ncbi:MAG: acylphosphatase [Candidatus Bathyarchaeota archaeon]|nr:acylphosphatase [Candidatus Bathyarchaeota archaeon]